MKLVGKALRATPEEIAHNPRARSAVLRVAEVLYA
jgi:16S rRNA C1402 N4-methylase RsmH